MDGPQADTHPPAPWRTGFIYEETRGTPSWNSPSLEDWKIDESHARKGWKWHADGWNTMRIECRGTRIRTWVNAAPITDYDGKGTLDDADHLLRRVGLTGHIALQLHNKDELLVQFKEIRLRPLD
ncbi:MAG: DUF1080 domain-containing protein [bacterium]|nr:DUF1080 domain-containing protein [bacterium]